MIQLIPVQNPEEIEPAYKPLYTEAFPPDERRNWQQLLKLISHPEHLIYQIYSEKQFVGFVTIWHFSGFKYIEHFAIHQAERNKGLGSEVIRQILQHESKPVILETEEPSNGEARKRIRFYERLGFQLNSGIYYQPPYSDDKKAVKMLLMSYPQKLQQPEFEKIKNQIHQKVYLKPE